MLYWQMKKGKTNGLFLTYLSGFLTLNMALRDFNLESTW